MQIVDCFESGASYDSCVQGTQNTNRERWYIDPVRYSDNDANPYFVGSTAWRALHPTAAAANDAAAAAVPSASIVPQGVALPIVTADRDALPSSPEPQSAPTAQTNSIPWALVLGALALILLGKH